MRDDTSTFLIPAFFRKLTIVMLFCMGASGCSTLKSITSDKDSKELYRSRDQYVRIIKQDAVKGVKVPPNDHPVLLEAEQLRIALGSLEFILPKKDRSSRVFEKPELDLLVRYLSNAMEQAGPDEDVAFAVVGDYLAVYGLAKEQMFTSARMFYREGKLNIIFGDIHGKYWPNVDRRIYPLAPGSRSIPLKHEWKLLGYPYQEFYTDPDGQRTDWLVIDLAAMAARAAMGEKETATVPPHAKTVEERLAILEDLRKKKMITEDEYLMKRASILNEL
jgi:hypothetical protein